MGEGYAATFNLGSRGDPSDIPHAQGRTGQFTGINSPAWAKAVCDRLDKCGGFTCIVPGSGANPSGSICGDPNSYNMRDKRCCKLKNTDITENTDAHDRNYMCYDKGDSNTNYFWYCWAWPGQGRRLEGGAPEAEYTPVSYTHLTLPTILRV